jgi:hypothetical protein
MIKGDLCMKQYPISIDTAIEAIGIIIRVKFKKIQRENNPEQVQMLRNEIKMLNHEMQILYGLEGDEKTRMKIYNKVNDVYCPQIKSNVSTPEYGSAMG